MRNANPLGKCTARIDIPVPESLVDDIKVVARMRGYPAHTEWVRDTLEKIVAGELVFMERRLNGVQK